MDFYCTPRQGCIVDVEDKELGVEMDPLLTGVSLLRSFKRLIVGKPLACLV